VTCVAYERKQNSLQKLAGKYEGLMTKMTMRMVIVIVIIIIIIVLTMITKEHSNDQYDQKFRNFIALSCY